MRDDGAVRRNVCGGVIEGRGYKHARCPRCGQVSNLCCDPEVPATCEGQDDAWAA